VSKQTLGDATALSNAEINLRVTTTFTYITCPTNEAIATLFTLMYIDSVKQLYNTKVIKVVVDARYVSIFTPYITYSLRDFMLKLGESV
jgi:hypothetical protein